MEFNLSSDVENFLKLILTKAQKLNKRVFFAGGIVRDNILGIDIKDTDIIIEGSAIDFSSSLPHEIKIKSVHKDFDTVKLLYKNITFDLASTREETYPHSGCLPVVNKAGVDINLDVKRRDFTVNSLYSLIESSRNKITFKLIDLVRGVDDINAKTLRVLHKNSYIDDPTRILRGVDFKFRFGFDFSKEDKLLIEDYFNNNFDTSYLSYDRTLNVFKKILSGKNHKDIFRELIEKKYYKILFKDDIEVNFELIEHIFDLFRNLKFKKEEFYILILNNIHPEKLSWDNKKKLFNIFSKTDVEKIMYYYYVYRDDMVLWYLNNINFSFCINGNDLISLGYKKGELFGKIFDALFEYKTSSENKLCTKNDEIKWVLSNFPLN